MNDEVQGFTDEEIAAEVMSGNLFKVEDSVNEPDDSGQEEEENTEELADDEAEEEEQEEAVNNTATEDKKRSKFIPRDRFDQVTERARAADERAARLELKLEQQQAAMEKLLAKLGGQADDAPAEEDEVMDEALERKVEERFSKLDERDFERALSTEYQQAVQVQPDFGNAYEYLVANTAFSVIQRAESIGRDIPEYEAIKLAQQAINEELKTVYKHNPRTGNMARHIYALASSRGYTAPTKTTGEKPKNSVNMKAVARAREEAGAPNVKKESVNVTGASWQDEVFDMGKKIGLDAEYLRKVT